MKKNHKYDVLSNVQCACGRFIKQNVIDRKPNTTVCYYCGRKKEEAKGNMISSAKEVRNGTRPQRKMKSGYEIGSKCGKKK